MLGATAEGRALLDRLYAILGLCHRRLELTVENSRDMKRGTITFGMPGVWAHIFLPISAGFPRVSHYQVSPFQENNSTGWTGCCWQTRPIWLIMHFQEENAALAYKAFLTIIYLVIPGGMTGPVGFPGEKTVGGGTYSRSGTRPLSWWPEARNCNELADQF